MSESLGPRELLTRLFNSDSKADAENIISTLPIAEYEEHVWDDRSTHWNDSRLHWMPVGKDRGNAGRINLAGDPYNPLAERLVNGMEAIIEYARRTELLSNPQASIPQSPREAVERYFGLPRIDLIPRIEEKQKRQKLEEELRKLRTRLTVTIDYSKAKKEFSVEIKDKGIGQSGSQVHKTLLSLGQTDKADKPYMIGVFGQGGSSTFCASQYSFIVSRRAAPFLDGASDEVGWTVVKKIAPVNRRDPFYAYLAVDKEGHVPTCPGDVADQLGFDQGVVFRHIGYDFGRGGSGIARTPYYALNHVLFNPVLPYDLYALKEKPDPMYGNASRLAKRALQFEKQGQASLDKSFPNQGVPALS